MYWTPKSPGPKTTLNSLHGARKSPQQARTTSHERLKVVSDIGPLSSFPFFGVFLSVNSRKGQGC